jgi:heterodisulfide reductase subunit C
LTAQTATNAAGPRAPAMTFLEEVENAVPGDARLVHCIQCGTCGGSCPSGPDMEHTPRRLFAMIEAGMRGEVLRSNTPWYCVSCYYCTTRCPQEIHITDIMYALKRMSLRDGYSRQSTAAGAPGFSETFIDFVEHYGRAFELGLAALYHMRRNPVGAVKMATSMGLGMFMRGRMEITPTRIRRLDELKSILGEAKRIGGAS